MSRFQVDSDEVLMTQQSALAVVERIQADSATLMAQLSGLNGSWTGQAAAAFQQAVAGWRQTQQLVEQNAQALQAALAAAGRQYAEAESANAALFRQ
ncbi:WXG100 family type VII secretion target [Ruicaihuangia caeni]|uniref:WXG100 family type VII secretion target n=1 Tax=Ruicaihuangia caeni TaxID=3042517 RepID=UPI00338F8930